MPRITKVYTRGGDDGTTSLGDGRRVKKDSLRIEAYGTVDELNSQIGAAVASGLDPVLATILGRIQNELFHLGSDLCVPGDDKAARTVPRIEQRHVDALERDLDRLNAQLDPLHNFVLPGGTAGAAALHVARTVCRRAERLVVGLGTREPLGEWTIRYLNRLSDMLFVLARFENKQRGAADVCWNSRA